ncbi:hypothetical protein, partial [Propionivibrio sp.]|uniref:hypothetical protein n=1 Tax=Propionivibrio sp. TaxID=2212460 RepID=UPI003BF067CC
MGNLEKEEKEDEINLGDMVDFLGMEWRNLGLAALAGLAVALLGQFKAEAILLNSTQLNSTQLNSTQLNS